MSKSLADLTPEERIRWLMNPNDDGMNVTEAFAALRDADRKWALLKAADALEKKAHEREPDYDDPRDVDSLDDQTWDAAAEFLRNFDPEG